MALGTLGADGDWGDPEGFTNPDSGVDGVCTCDFKKDIAQLDLRFPYLENPIAEALDTVATDYSP